MACGPDPVHRAVLYDPQGSQRGKEFKALHWQCMSVVAVSNGYVNPTTAAIMSRFSLQEALCFM